MDDPNTSQGEDRLPPPDWSDDQQIVVDTAYEIGWTLERLLGASHAIIKVDLVDADSRQCSELLQYLTACHEGEKICEAEYRVKDR